MSIITQSMLNHARIMTLHANTGLWTGQVETTVLPYFRDAKKLHYDTGTLLIFTREIGYHTSGWFKNPDYERCYHLSMSFHDIQNQTYRPFEPELAKAWCAAFYGDNVRYIWEEGQTDEAKANPNLAESRHFRVFCDPTWQPIIPRGEVYTKDFTEKGWLSWSDKQYKEGKR